METAGRGSQREMSLNAPAKVIVLGAHYGALSVVRGFARQGIKPIVVTSNPQDHACHSRFTARVVIGPEPAACGPELVKMLLEADRDWDGALLIPTLDEYESFVSQNRLQLSQRFVFAVQDWSIVGSMINKNCLYPRAATLGVRTPWFFLPGSLDDLCDHKSEYTFPCILKPFESRRFSETYGAKVLVAHDFEELVKKYADTQRHDLSVMICAIIPGDDSSIFTYRCYIDSQGDLLAELCSQKIRQYPPGFGQGSVQRTVPMIETIRDQALKLLRSFGYRGQSSTEFRLDPRDNQYKLMETNIRPGTIEWMLIAAGMNFTYMTYLDLVKGIREKRTEYVEDLYCIHNHWEAVHFINTLMAGKLNLYEFLAPYRQKKVFVVPFLEDPWNYLFELIQNTGRLSRKLRHRSLWQ